MEAPMQRIILNDDIHSLSEFRSNTSSFISQVHNTKRPLVITQNGRSAAVLLDVEEYEKLLEKIELFQDVEIALDQVSKGKAVLHANAYKMLKTRYTK
jgi:prevent-host-death family protein